MRSFVAALTAVLLLAGDGIQVLAGKCKPDDPCFASLSNDPPGASPFCSSILGYPEGVVVVSSNLATAVVSVTSTVEQTLTATQTAVTRTVVRDGTTEFLTSTSWFTVSESTTATVSTEQLVSSLVVVTSPVLQTSVSAKTVQDTVYEYRSTTATVIVATVTEYVTATFSNYIRTQTQAISTTTITNLDIVWGKRDVHPLRRMAQTSGRPEVPVPTYLSTCRADDILSICSRLYPSEAVETVTSYYTPPAVVSNILVTKTVYATQPQQTQAVTVNGPLVTSVIWVGETKTVYSTKTITVTVTQIAPYTSVDARTEIVVVPSTVTEVKTVTTYSPTVIDGRTTFVTVPTTITQEHTLTVFVPFTTVTVRTTMTVT